MTNPNKAKGVASRLESLVNYPGQKRRKVRKQEETDEPTDDKLLCICSEEETCNDVLLHKDKPDLKDFINVIKENGVLDDSEMSKQLLFLMTYFIKAKTTKDQNMLPKISGS